MRWVRSNRRWGGWVALAALTLQLAVSFGHIHLDGLHRGVPAVAAALQGGDVPPAPAQHPNNDTADYCAICATIHLAANAPLPTPPQLALPLVRSSVEHFDRVAAVFVAPRRAPFQSRAPPLA